MAKASLLFLKILSHYHTYIDNAYKLPDELVNILLIHASLLNLSYIYYTSKQSWIYCFLFLVRPSIIIQIQNFYIAAICYIVIELVYILNNQLPGKSYVSLINSLLKVGLLNFIIEQFENIQGMLVGTYIIILQLLDTLLLQETLDVETKNFQLTQTTILTIINQVCNMLMMILYKLQFKLQVLQILAIVNSVFKAIELLITATQRSQVTIQIMISIQFITIFLGLIQFMHYEDSYTLVLLPFYFKLISFLKFSDFTFSNDSIINASLLLQQQKYYECLTILNKISEQNFHRVIRKNALLKKCVNSINYKIHLTQRNEDLFGVAEQLIQQDLKNLKLSENIQSIVKRKIIILQNWKLNDFQDVSEFIKTILRVKSEIDQYYLQQPSGMTQSLICFFYAEILNDILKANELQINLNKSGENLQNVNVLSKSTYYIIVKYQNGSLQLTKVSSNAPSSICNKTIQDLIPPGVREQHTKQVDQFLMTGKSQYVRQFNENYINFGNYLETINFAIDLTYLNSVTFICLINPVATKDLTMILDSKYIISSMTDQFASIKNSENVFIKGLSISQVIPTILRLEETTFLDNIQITSRNLPKDQNKDINKQADEIQYFCDISVKIAKIQNNVVYLILKFVNIKVTIISASTQIETKTIESSSDKFLRVAEEISRSTPTKQIIAQPIAERIWRQTSEQVIDAHSNRIQKRIKKKRQTSMRKTKLQVQSQVSSLKEFRNSKLYSKYNIYNKYLKQVPQKRLHRIIIGLIQLVFLQELIFILIQITNISLLTFSDDIKLLEMKELIFQPIQVFLVTRWTLFNYKNQLLAGEITQEDYDFKSVFALSNLNLGYDQLNVNIESVLFKSQLQPLLQQKYIYAYQYLDTYQNERYNITFRTAVQILLNFQYTLKMNYVYDGTVNIDSPQIFYSYKNYMLLNDLVTELNVDIFKQTFLRVSWTKDKILIIFVIKQVLIFFYLSAASYIKYLMNRYLLMRINLYSFVEEKEIQIEIKQQQELLCILKTDNSYKFSYKFDFELKELQLDKPKNNPFGVKLQGYQLKGVTFIRFNMLIFLLYSFFTIIDAIIYVLQNNYLMKYPDTLTYDQAFANLDIDIPLMFGRREILYGRNKLMYLTQTDFDYDLLQIKKSLSNTIYFTSMDIDFSKLLITESFHTYYDEIQSNDLCNYIPPDIKSKSISLCQIIFNNNMKLGLKAILIDIQNLIFNEMDINYFVERNTTTPNELEGVFILSQIIKVMKDLLFNDLIQQTRITTEEIDILNICFLFFIILLSIFGTPYLYLKLFDNTSQIVHFAYIIPKQTLFNNNVFERVVRSQILQN